MAPAQLQVTVRSASGLQKPKRGIISGRPSAYVVIEVVGKEGVRFQTPVVKQSFSPLWDFACVIDSFDACDTLQFTLMDCSSWSRSDKVLGKVSLTRDDLHSNDCQLELAFAECETNATLFLAVVADETAAIDKVGSNQFPLSTASTSLGEGSPMIFPLRVVCVDNQAKQVLAPCFPAPIICTGEEAAADFMEITAFAASNDAAQNPEKGQKKRKKDRKRAKKAGRCC